MGFKFPNFQIFCNLTDKYNHPEIEYMACQPKYWKKLLQSTAMSNYWMQVLVLNYSSIQKLNWKQEVNIYASTLRWLVVLVTLGKTERF